MWTNIVILVLPLIWLCCLIFFHTIGRFIFILYYSGRSAMIKTCLIFIWILFENFMFSISCIYLFLNQFILFLNYDYWLIIPNLFNFMHNVRHSIIFLYSLFFIYLSFFFIHLSFLFIYLSFIFRWFALLLIWFAKLGNFYLI
jgi:hypothetical protein